MAQQGKALDPKVKRRVAELVGLGLTYDEAARAKQVHIATVNRIMADPDYRKIADEVESTRIGGSAILTEVYEVVKELLDANFESGDANPMLRAKGAELLLKYKDVLAPVDPDGTAGAALPQGVTIISPRTPDTLDPALTRDLAEGDIISVRFGALEWKQRVAKVEPDGTLWLTAVPEDEPDEDEPDDKADDLIPVEQGDELVLVGPADDLFTEADLLLGSEQEPSP